MTDGKTPRGARGARDSRAGSHPGGHARPLNIAVVCYPGLGGSGVVAAELALGLAARGHRIHVVATAVPERIKARLAAGLAAELHFEHVEVPTSPVFEHGPYDVAVASHLIELARREGIDLVHLHYAVPHAASALLARQVLGAAAPAMVTTLHGTDVTRLGAHPSLHAVTAFALAACDGLTTPSQFLKHAAVERFGLPAEHIEVIPNFVDLERFAPPPQRNPDTGELGSLFAHRTDGPLLFHVSNFRPIKRPLDLIEVLVRVRRVLPARLVLVGDGPGREAVHARARELGVGDAVGWLGRRDDFAGLLGHADGFVLPSESEGFGVVALEAMAAGVPVFGYHVGGLPEVVVAGTGALVRCGDVDALAQAVVAGVGDRAIRDAMGRAGRARAERAELGYSRDAALTRYDSYFRRVLASQSTSRIQGGLP